MNEWISISIYINKSKNVALVPYKLSEAGFGVASEPIIQVGNEEWDNISQYILGLLDEVSKDPLSEENESTVFKKICGSRGFRYFSKRHICHQIIRQIVGQFQIHFLGIQIITLRGDLGDIDPILPCRVC